MPSILVETGYISNPEEEDYLNSESGQQETAAAIVRAVEHYSQSLQMGLLISSETQSE